MERAQKLYDIGFHDGILADLVAYGQLVGLLTEFPEKQKEVVAYVTEKKPEIALSDKPAIASLSYEDCTNMLKQAFPTRFQAIIDCMQQHTKQEKQP